MTAAITRLQGDVVSRVSSLYYADNDAIRSLDHKWLQYANQHLCNLFRDCTGLVPNTEKTETLSCHPGAIWRRCSTEGYRRRHKGTGDTYAKREGKKTVCPIPSCGKDLALGSLQSHLRTQHGIDSSGSIINKPIELMPRSYKLSFTYRSGHSKYRVPCPVEGCLYKAGNAANLQRHFFSRHYTYRLHIEGDGRVPSNCRGVVYWCHSIHCNTATLTADNVRPI